MNDLPPGRGRYAPSPTGHLHLGNLRTAVLAWLFARKAAASFILRLEDLDRPRMEAGAAAQIIADLRWLGLDWDEGPDVGGPFEPYTQSDRFIHYREHLQRLLQADLVYPCYCSRADVARAASAPHGLESPALRYPGTCADAARREALRVANPGRRPSYRFRVPAMPIQLVDRIEGLYCQELQETVGDFVIWRADGIPAYHFAVVVDDALMRVGEVVRGVDLLESTPRQIALFRALGYPVPTYAHVPLLRNQHGERLAKRENSDGLGPLRAAGRLPAEVLSMLATSCGLVQPGTHCGLGELLTSFEPAQLRHSSWTEAS